MVDFDDVIGFFEDLWDKILEAPSNLFEFLGGMFSDMSELSYTGIAFGILSAGIIFFLRDYTLQPFVVSMTPLTRIFWVITTYVGCFVGGYFLGKAFDNS